MSVDAVDHAEREQRLSQVLGAYFEAVEAGQAPDPQALIQRHPDLAAELRDFFAHQARFDRMVEPLRAAHSGFPPSSRSAVEIATLMLDDSADPQAGASPAKPSIWGEGHPKLPIQLHGDTTAPLVGARLRYFGD
ncbi:MAG TPA: hypothetical protein VGZ22_02745, partial [Isosphaeraceae bacterium]|nr:hypothetical protein [Isosphaeraceae bacterium]